MKKVLLISMAMLCAFLSHGQDFTSLSREPIYTSPIFIRHNKAVPDPVLPGERMRNVGRGLTIGGVGLAVLGIVLISSADEVYYTTTTGPNGTQESGDPKGALGLMMTVGGVGMGVTGIILWSKGQRNTIIIKKDRAFLSARLAVVLRFVIISKGRLFSLNQLLQDFSL